MKKNEKKHKKSGRADSALNVLLLVQLIFMVILSIGITKLISTSTTQSSDNYMKTIVEERSRIILNYVESAEQILTDYSHSTEIKNAVVNPDDKAAVEAAQKFTQEYSKDIVNLEGIYVSRWDTYVLAHTDRSTAGITTRTDEDSLRELQDELILSGDSVYNTGIISSPATGRQIVSLYRAVFDENGEPAGIVGLGIYTEGLVNVLDSLTGNDMKNAFYSMVSTSDGRYIFHRNENMVSAEVSMPELKELCSRLAGKTEDESGKFTYSAGGADYVSVYSYIGETGWIFMIDDTQSEVYRLTLSMRGYMIVFCIFCFVLIVLFNILNKKREDAANTLNSVVEKHERTRESLENAVYNDFLTDIGNRISFSSDFEAGKIEPEEGTAYYFALFNIKEFSKVNIVFGEEVGDMILISTAKLLNKHFPDAKIYRTGSDEFLVSQNLPKDNRGQNSFMNNINEVMNSFSKPFDVGTAKVNVGYSVAAASKSVNVNISVLPSLKNMMSVSSSDSISVTDLDMMNT